MKRSGKFYFKNEKEVMKSLGLEPTKGSGSGWIEKEDGQNEYIIAQLKSTDAMSTSIKLKDITTLEYNASVTRKIPLFIIEFLQTGELYFLVKLENIPEVNQYINCGECNKPNEAIIDDDDKLEVEIKAIKSSKQSRNKFWKNREKEWKK